MAGTHKFDNKRKRASFQQTITTRSSSRRQNKPSNEGELLSEGYPKNSRKQQQTSTSRASKRLRTSNVEPGIAQDITSISSNKENEGSLSFLAVTSEVKEEEEEDEEEGEVEEDDEDLPQFEYEHKYNNDDGDVSGDENNNNDLDLVSGHKLDLFAQNPNILDDLEEETQIFEDNEDSIFKSSNNFNINSSRWPIDEQDYSTSFSILLKPPHITNTTQPPAPALCSPTESTYTTPEPQTPEVEKDSSSIEDFVIYNEDDSNNSSSSISAIIEDTRAKVPLYGYRDRHTIEQANTKAANANTNRLMATFSAMSNDNEQEQSPVTKALFQQAVIASDGLNRRSLWSGKAREMVGGNDSNNTNNTNDFNFFA